MRDFYQFGRGVEYDGPFVSFRPGDVARKLAKFATIGFVAGYVVGSLTVLAIVRGWL